MVFFLVQEASVEVCQVKEHTNVQFSGEKKTKKDLWFGVYGRDYDRDEPAFFDESALPQSRILKDNYQIIRGVLEKLINNENNELVSYFDDSLQDPPKNWKTLGFYSWGRKYDRLRKYPELEEILDKIPDLLTASFNMLEPNSRILPHFGETNATFRIHLGIDIPEGLPKCGFRVKDEARAWQEGELLIFLDANKHEAFNYTEKRRYILLLEVMRPEFAHMKTEVCVQSLAMLSLYFILSKIPFLSMPWLAEVSGNIPKSFQDVVIFPLKVLWRMIFLKNAIKAYAYKFFRD